jgi:hypothetical protein
MEGRKGKDRTILFVLVNTTKEAIEACQDWDVDVLILQGKRLEPKHHIDET